MAQLSVEPRPGVFLDWDLGSQWSYELRRTHPPRPTEVSLTAEFGRKYGGD